VPLVPRPPLMAPSCSFFSALSLFSSLHMVLVRVHFSIHFSFAFSAAFPRQSVCTLIPFGIISLVISLPLGTCSLDRPGAMSAPCSPVNLFFKFSACLGRRRDLCFVKSAKWLTIYGPWIDVPDIGFFLSNAGPLFVRLPSGSRWTITAGVAVQVCAFFLCDCRSAIRPFSRDELISESPSTFAGFPPCLTSLQDAGVGFF